ncbi:MAG: translation initiation factor [Planctomycetes bacterium]|nr:translation initiation factor [Planctomycetota bacterium]
MSGLFAGTPLEQPVTCERCGKTIAQCACPRDRRSGKTLDPKDQQLRIRREQRRGKFTTVIAGFAARSDRTDDLPALLKQLKAKFATGGTVDSTDPAAPVLELQGDHRDRLVEHFKSLGYPAKPAGG